MKITTTIYIDKDVKDEAAKAAHEEKPKSSLSRKVEELLLRWLKERETPPEVKK